VLLEEGVVGIGSLETSVVLGRVGWVVTAGAVGLGVVVVLGFTTPVLAGVGVNTGVAVDAGTEFTPLAGGIVALGSLVGGIPLLSGGVVPSADPPLVCAKTWREKEKIKIIIKKIIISFFIFLLYQKTNRRNKLIRLRYEVSYIFASISSIMERLRTLNDSLQSVNVFIFLVLSYFFYFPRMFFKVFL
jgi:hypothetical protein